MNTSSSRFPLRFLLLAIVLIGAYYLLPDDWINNIIVRYFAVVPGGAILDMLTPNAIVITSQSRILSPLANLNILKGCEGTEALLILYAAILAMLRPFNQSLTGIFLGTLLVFFLNQLRIIALFFIVAYYKPYFEWVHGFLAPMVIVIISGIYFLLWLRATQKPRMKNT